MTVTLILDQGLAPRAAFLLRQRGIDAVHVSEIGMAEADDAVGPGAYFRILIAFEFVSSQLRRLECELI